MKLADFTLPIIDLRSPKLKSKGDDLQMSSEYSKRVDERVQEQRLNKLIKALKTYCQSWRMCEDGCRFEMGKVCPKDLLEQLEITIDGK